ncbi:hypothetical protein PROFUN_03445 [Planoprotostelium fungivorum]|uniref:Uncharacterized protein n=1 Tax=Planoprotostelium fungivorum TaxID=1890364 RepID=A0A2P6MN56_9EUKA|nr:hypothetical protein PROFUN_03445 [Planoprotostelium fungivorum]
MQAVDAHVLCQLRLFSLIIEPLGLKMVSVVTPRSEWSLESYGRVKSSPLPKLLKAEVLGIFNKEMAPIGMKKPRTISACDACRSNHQAYRPCLRCVEEEKECVTSGQKRRKYVLDSHTVSALVKSGRTPLRPTLFSSRVNSKHVMPLAETPSQEKRIKTPHPLAELKSQQTGDTGIYPPSMWTLDDPLRETINTYLRFRGFDDVEDLLPDFTNERESTSRDLRQSSTIQQRHTMNCTFQSQIEEAIEESDFDVPTLIWTRGLDVYYMNDSFRASTNCTSHFDSPQLQLYNMLSTHSIKDLCGKIKLTYLSTSDKPLSLTLLFSSGVQRKGELTVKRDLFGYPQLFCLHLSPQASISGVNLSI